MTHTGAGEILEHRAAEAAGADDQNAALREDGLALRAYVFEQNLP